MSSVIQISDFTHQFFNLFTSTNIATHQPFRRKGHVTVAMAAPPRLPGLFLQPENVQTNNGDTENEPMIDISNLQLLSEQDTPTSDYSAGNTPEISSDTEDSYSPPMDTTFLPGHPISDGLRHLMEMIDFIPKGAAVAGGKPTQKDYATWKGVLFSRDFTHDEYKSALAYAVDMVLKAKKTSIPSEEEVNGLQTEWPLRTILWKDISLDSMARMNSMAIKSGILQACKAL